MAARDTLSDVLVTWVAAASVDGKVSTADDAGPRFTSSADKAHLTEFRADADAVVLGARTVANDDPAFHLPKKLQARRRARGVWSTPIRAVVSGRASVSPNARLFQGHESPALVFVAPDAPGTRVSVLSEAARVHTSGSGAAVDVREVLTFLAEEYDVRRVLLEGGPEVTGAFLAAGLIDEVHLTVCPYLIGGAGVPSAIGGAGLALDELLELRLIDVRVEAEVFLHYAVVRPPAQP